MNETTELIMKQLNSKKVHAETHEVGGGDEIDVAKLKGIGNYVTRTGDFSGTWNGLAMTSVEPGLSTAFAALKVDVENIVLDLSSYSRLSGEIDDSGLIQRAINDAVVEKKKIFIPSKTFQFSSTINMYNGVSFLGQNRENSLLQYTGTGIAFNLIDTVNNVSNSFGYGCYYNSFENLTIQGNSTSNASTAIKGELRYSSFNNVTVKRFGTLVDVSNNWTNNYINCLFTEADIWYKAGSQNNAVTFSACQWGASRVGFQMQSCNKFSIIGGNVEGCTDVLFLPSQAGGCRWSNFSIVNAYLENSGQLINTAHVSGDGNPITSWNFYGFEMKNCNVNFMVSGAFIYTRLSDVIMGEIRGCVFYRNVNSPLFDMDSTRIILQNYYFWYNSGTLTTMTTAISSFMLTGNSGYTEVIVKSGNVNSFSGTVEALKGINLGASPTTPIEGSMFYSSPNKRVIYNNGSGNVHIQPIQSGTTAQRPSSSLQVGQMVFDTTLGKPIWRNAANSAWVDATGTTV